PGFRRTRGSTRSVPARSRARRASRLARLARSSRLEGRSVAPTAERQTTKRSESSGDAQKPCPRLWELKRWRDRRDRRRLLGECNVGITTVLRPERQIADGHRDRDGTWHRQRRRDRELAPTDGRHPIGVTLRPAGSSECGGGQCLIAERGARDVLCPRREDEALIETVLVRQHVSA